MIGNVGSNGHGRGAYVAGVDSGAATPESPATESESLLNPVEGVEDPTLQSRKSEPASHAADAGVQVNNMATNPRWSDKAEAKPRRGDPGGSGSVSFSSARNSGPLTSVDASLNPQLIRTGSITIRVRSAQDAMNQAIGIAKSMGGYHEASHHSAGKGYDAQADVTIRVPVTRFDRALTALRELGEVTDDSSESQDVTAEIADVGARLKVMRAEEESYVTMLRSGRKVGEILEIKDRLSTVRQEIESLTAQQKALKNQSSYSTISCSFTQRPRAEVKAEPTNWIEDAWANGANGAKSLGRAIATFGIFALSYAPFWLPVVLLGWFLSRRRSA
ncbi:MAG: DUF4349 domain-containing protein [Fimbriimonadaceae bacterium]